MRIFEVSFFWGRIRKSTYLKQSFVQVDSFHEPFSFFYEFMLWTIRERLTYIYAVHIYVKENS